MNDGSRSNLGANLIKCIRINDILIYMNDGLKYLFPTRISPGFLFRTFSF